MKTLFDKPARMTNAEKVRVLWSDNVALREANRRKDILITNLRRLLKTRGMAL